MSVLRHLLTGFMAGELDPHLEGRVETEQYAYGLSVCENFVPLNEGPLVKRQGFEMIRPAASTASWFSAFRRSIDEEYVLEWSELAVRFYTNGARIETDPVTPYEVTVPYGADEAPFLSEQQNFNRRYLNHSLHPPGALRRDTATTFTYEELGRENGPFLDTNTDESVTVTASAATGSGITLTASAAIFAAGHVGSLIRLKPEDFASIPQWEPGMKSIAVNDKCHNRGRVYQAATAGTTGSVEPLHSEGSYYDGQLTNDLLNDKGPYGVKWTYLHDMVGIVEITAVASGTSATGTVKRRLADAVVSAGTFKWAHSAFSEEEGWPSLVAIGMGRRIDFKDIDMIGSVVDDYGGGRVNYQTHTTAGVLAADLGFRRTLSSENPPLWVSVDRKFLVGTATTEFAIGPLNNAAAFSGENIEAQPQSFYGSEQVYPVKIGTETFFVEIGGRRIRSADYEFGRDRYDAPDVTAAARAITTGGIVQLAFQRIPHALVFGVRGDGQLVCHPKTRAEIKGFSRFALGGGARVLSAVAVVGADKRHDLWALVEREDGSGATVREVWKQAAWRELGDPLEEAFYVDGGARVEATGGDGDFTGFDHLADQEVVALVGGVVVKGLTVASDGSLSLPAEAVPEDDYVAIVGLPYTATATTMRPHVRGDGGGTTGLRQRVVKVVSRILETLGLKVAVPGQPTPEEVVLRRGEQAMDEQIPLYSGDSDGLVDADFDRDGRASWIHDDPLPCTVSLAILNIDVSKRDE